MLRDPGSTKVQFYDHVQDITLARALTNPSDSVLIKCDHSQAFTPLCQSCINLSVSDSTRPPVDITIAVNFPCPAGAFFLACSATPRRYRSAWARGALIIVYVSKLRLYICYVRLYNSHPVITLLGSLAACTTCEEHALQIPGSVSVPCA
jgi:hypothetical protein